MTESVIRRWVKWLTADSIFFRCCMFVAGAGICSSLMWAWWGWPIPDAWVWLALVPLSAFGGALMLIPWVASDKRFERYVDLMGDGGDIPVIVLLVVVMCVAIPMTVAIRRVRRARQ